MLVMCCITSFYGEGKYLETPQTPNLFARLTNTIQKCDLFVVLSINGVPKSKAMFHNTKQYVFIDDKMKIYRFLHSPDFNPNLIEEIFECDSSKFDSIIKKRKLEYSSPYRVLC